MKLSESLKMEGEPSQALPRTPGKARPLRRSRASSPKGRAKV